MVLEAGYPNTTGFRKVVKMSVMIKKKAGMLDADFIAHYNSVHAQMAAPVVHKHGAISYSLVRLLASRVPRCPVRRRHAGAIAQHHCRVTDAADCPASGACK